MAKVLDLLEEARKRRNKSSHAHDVYLFLLTHELTPATSHVDSVTNNNLFEEFAYVSPDLMPETKTSDKK